MTVHLISARKRPLSALLNQMKAEATRCDCCEKLMTRVTMLRDGKVVPKVEISQFTHLVSENEWLAEKTRWNCVCRFCGEIHNARNEPLNLARFWRWMRVNKMRESTAREYWLRLRRLNEQLMDKVVNIDDRENMMSFIMSIFPEDSMKNYISAMNKYYEFLNGNEAA